MKNWMASVDSMSPRPRLLLVKVVFLVSAAATTAACVQSDELGQELPSDEPLGPRLDALERDLLPGATGDDVEAVQDYLASYGYLPNDALAEEYPAWRPLVSESPSVGVFDDATAEAVRHLQRMTAIPVTGIVDADTRQILRSPRCGVPEGLEHLDPAAKYALNGSRWNQATVTWAVMNTDGDVTLAQARGAASAAFAVWAAQTTRTFVQAADPDDADIQIRFASIDGPGGVAGQSASPAGGGDHVLDTAETWSVATPTPSGQYDLQVVMTHELGHGLGVTHSSLSAARMFQTIGTGPRTRSLHIDDTTAISAIYDTWDELPGGAKDIGASSDGSVWIIGESSESGGFGIYKWNGSGWTQANGGAVRIAVAPNGVPWIVNSSGDIFRRTNNSASSGSWTLMPGQARDIGIGNNGSVWIIGESSESGGFSIHTWTGSSWTKVNGGAVRIAVGPTGVPWIVNDDDDIFRRGPTGLWEQLPGEGLDIGIGAGNYAWLVGRNQVSGGFGVYTWDEQVAVGTAPVRAEWVNVSGGAVAISVGPNARPWIVNNDGEIFRTVR